jgi:hypothetical protein
VTADGRRWSGRFLIEARGRAASGRSLRGPPALSSCGPYACLPARSRTALATFERGWAGGEVRARYAEASRAALPLEQHLIRVGVAARAPDPLSGHGVFEALASARATLPVINTIRRLAPARALPLRQYPTADNQDLGRDRNWWEIGVEKLPPSSASCSRYRRPNGTPGASARTRTLPGVAA